tara:strand:+ start:31924 stop:33267 length:1344 start_codon:yes stop_codon:yes gene_type:complete
MARNNTGGYTLPAGNPVTTGAVIESNWANTTLTDLAEAMTDSLSRSGNGGMLVPFKQVNGSVTSPALTFENFPSTGFYAVSATDVRMSVQGVDAMRWLKSPAVAQVWNSGTAMWENIFTGVQGTAAGYDVGTAADQIPTNADVRNPRNRIVNPSMAISQENGFVSPTVSAGAWYGFDQWKTKVDVASNCFINMDSAGYLNGSRSLKQTVTTAATVLTGFTDAGGLAQTIEGSNIFDLNGGDVTLSFDVETNWSGNLAVAFQKGDGTKTYVVDAPVVAGVQTIVLVVPFEVDTVPAPDNSEGFSFRIGVCNEGSLLTTATDSWEVNSAFCSNVSTQWIKTINNYVEITNVDLYAGNVPREFQPNSYAYDDYECKRYFEIVQAIYLASGQGQQRAIVQKRGLPIVLDGQQVGTGGTYYIFGFGGLYNTISQSNSNSQESQGTVTINARL